MSDRIAEERDRVRRLVGDKAGEWDIAGGIPHDVLRELGTSGALCAQTPRDYGGLGAGSRENGDFTAFVGSLCGSLRSVMTSQGMAAWAIQRLGDPGQRAALLPALAGGTLAAVAFSEPGAGSDVGAMETRIRAAGDDTVIVDGHKTWITAAAYADLVVVFGTVPGETNGTAAAVVVPADAAGVLLEPVAHPLGCRAAGHAHLRLDRVRLPAANVLGGAGLSLPILTASVLAYGRMSVAWGCVGILRACLDAATEHARTRSQFGHPIARHQLVSRMIAEIFVAERVAARMCRHASECWEAGSPELVIAAVLAKHVSATQAMRGATSAMQVMASAGASDGHVVARAYRDAKLMEIIEGSNEICQLLLADHALTAVSTAERGEAS